MGEEAKEDLGFGAGVRVWGWGSIGAFGYGGDRGRKRGRERAGGGIWPPGCGS